MPEYVAQAPAKFVTYCSDLLVGGSTIGASIAPVFDKCDLRTGRAEHMIVVLVDRAIEPMCHHPSNLTSESRIEACRS
jgi:hypothetical protein